MNVNILDGFTRAISQCVVVTCMISACVCVCARVRVWVHVSVRYAISVNYKSYHQGHR